MHRVEHVHVHAGHVHVNFLKMVSNSASVENIFSYYWSTVIFVYMVSDSANVGNMFSYYWSTVHARACIGTHMHAHRGRDFDTRPLSNGKRP